MQDGHLQHKRSQKSTALDPRRFHMDPDLRIRSPYHWFTDPDPALFFRGFQVSRCKQDSISRLLVALVILTSVTN
jgi:hypothetical protein